MRYFYIEPEVSGELGGGTSMDTTVHPPKVEKLNYEFSSWLGDDLIESFPCYIVSERLADKLKQSHFSGFVFDDVTVTKSSDFNDISTIKHLTSCNKSCILATSKNNIALTMIVIWKEQDLQAICIQD